MRVLVVLPIQYRSLYGDFFRLLPTSIFIDCSLSNLYDIYTQPIFSIFVDFLINYIYVVILLQHYLFLLFDNIFIVCYHFHSPCLSDTNNQTKKFN
jgi:hypothetical protein